MIKKMLQSGLRRATGYELVRAHRSTVPPVIPSYPINCSPRSSFEAAKLEAGAGYIDHSLIAETRQTPSKPLDQTNLQSHLAALFASLAIAASLQPTRPLRVLDFGGALGLYFHLVREAFEGRLLLDWTVVETDAYVAHADINGLANPRLFASIDEAVSAQSQFDFILFSGVLQYLEHWREPLSHAAVKFSPYVLISRTPIGDNEIPFLQTVNIPSRRSAWPGRILRLDDISAVLSRTHRVALTWDFDQHLGEMGVRSSPSVLWKRR
jgi:putative methyltransferase (TIGR04325 family)